MFLIVVAVFIGAAVFVTLTYTRFHREAQVRRASLLAGSGGHNFAAPGHSPAGSLQIES